jgi:hypothetical protein
VPGAFIERKASAAVPGVKISVPISQSASAALCFKDHCFTREPNTSDIDSLSAPGWL